MDIGAYRVKREILIARNPPKEIYTSIHACYKWQLPGIPKFFEFKFASLLWSCIYVKSTR